MADGRWISRMQQGDVAPARRAIAPLEPQRKYEKLVHLCKMSLWQTVSTCPLKVPHNESAAGTQLLLAPEWLFSHFPYGAFFPSFRQCHENIWQWPAKSALEQRLCMPEFRVPVVMVHMAGLRNGQWGRRGVMRALGFWNEGSDLVAKDSWVSSNTDKLLVTELPPSFNSMREFDMFAARLLLLGLLLGRKAVIPTMPCTKSWAVDAMEPRHLRGIEVGCGEHKQCVWLPMPHYKDPWCSGVDFLYDIDYRTLLSKSISAADVRSLPMDGLGVAQEGKGAGLIRPSSGHALPDDKVLVLKGDGSSTPLDWLPLAGFTDKSWRAPFPSRVKATLSSGSLSLDDKQLGIVKDCLHSLATSND